LGRARRAAGRKVTESGSEGLHSALS
jgi:hypothetical protein